MQRKASQLSNHSFKAPETLMKEVKAAAGANDLTLSQVVRKALTLWLHWIKKAA